MMVSVVDLSMSIFAGLAVTISDVTGGCTQVAVTVADAITLPPPVTLSIVEVGSDCAWTTPMREAVVSKAVAIEKANGAVRFISIKPPIFDGSIFDCDGKNSTKLQWF